MQKQLSLLSNKQQLGGTGAAEDILDEEDAPVNIRLASPDAKQLENAELQIQDKQYSDLQDQVKSFVKRTSLIKEA